MAETQSLAEWQREHGAGPLTLSDAGYLSDIIRAVERHARVTWYPLGGSAPEVHASYVMRSFAHDGGGLWFDRDGDVRDAYVWLSGTMEHWIKTSDLMAALKGMVNGREHDDDPLMIIEPEDTSRPAFLIA